VRCQLRHTPSRASYRATRVALDDTTSSELIGLLTSWRPHLTAQRMSPATLDTYSSSVRCLDRFLASAGLPQSAPKLREHVEAFITDLLGKWSPATTETELYVPDPTSRS
jgi:hypothetical protein